MPGCAQELTCARFPGVGAQQAQEPCGAPSAVDEEREQQGGMGASLWGCRRNPTCPKSHGAFSDRTWF